MDDRNEVALRTLLLGIAFLLALMSVTAQENFLVTGRFKIEGGGLDGARVVVQKEGKEVRTITSDLTRFTLPLELNSQYILSFEKPGYVTKRLSFNTAAPADAATQGFEPFDFAVSLFKQYDDMNLVVFDQPVGRIRFDASIGDFDYDTDYTRSIQRQMQEALDEVARKQKEEEKESRAEAKRREALLRDEAKARAEAEQEAARQEAEARRAAEAVPPPAPPKPKPVAEAAVVEPPRPRPVPTPASPPPAPIAKRVEPTATAPTHEGFDPRPAERDLGDDAAAAPEVEQELLVERDKVVMITRINGKDRTEEYRKVTHKWGGTFYFRNGDSCSRQVYELEVLGERVAGVAAGE